MSKILLPRHSHAHHRLKIREVVKAQGIRIYQPLVEADDEAAAAEHARVLQDAMPFSIIGSTEDVTTKDGRVVKGREYLWGVAEGSFTLLDFGIKLIPFAVENENHCDFRKLRSLLIRTHMLDLISTTEDLHYENYRQAQMEVRKFGEQKPRKFENPKFKEEEEALRKRFTEQVKAEEARFRQWEQHVSFHITSMNCQHAYLLISISLFKNAIVSIRISNWLIVQSKHSRRSSTTSKLVMAEGLAGGEQSPCWIPVLPARRYLVFLFRYSFVACLEITIPPPYPR